MTTNTYIFKLDFSIETVLNFWERTSLKIAIIYKWNIFYLKGDTFKFVREKKYVL